MSLLIPVRRFSGNAVLRTAITNLSDRKQGTGTGPFVELPDLQPLHDSLLLRIPSSSSVVGKLNNITVIDSSNELKDIELTKLFAVQKQKDTGFVTLSTADEPVNLICTASTRLNNVTVINLDDYEQGWTVNDPLNNILCYSGDVSINGNKIVGRGIFALNGQGSSWHIMLKESEQIVAPATSVLGFSSTVSVSPNKITSPLHFTMPTFFTLPAEVSTWIHSNITPKYEALRFQYNKLFRKNKIAASLQGPGIVILQHQNTNYSRNILYTDEALLEALKK
ncbi:hypothetical protein KDRO_C04180 [Kluyveromyces lactis]|nr:hypothetical protein KDRO_C04180 [Kluyveromyces lactis]